MQDHRFGLAGLVHPGEFPDDGFTRAVSTVHELCVIEPSVHEDGDGQPEYKYPADDVAHHMHGVTASLSCIPALILRLVERDARLAPRDAPAPAFKPYT